MVVTSSASGVELLKKAYSAFNARDLDGALATMQPDVVWPNGMEGGVVHGHEGVRASSLEPLHRLVGLYLSADSPGRADKTPEEGLFAA